MVLEVLRQTVAAIETLFDLGVRDIAGDDHRAVQRQACLDRITAELGADLAHRASEVDVHDIVAQHRVGDLGQEPRRVGLELFEEHAVA